MTEQQAAAAVMSADEAVDRLAAFPFLADVPREEIRWLVERGEIRQYAAGDVVRSVGSAIDEMDIPLTGRVSLYRERGGGWRRALETGAGYVMGVVPYSRMKTAPGTLIIEADGTTLFALHRKHFPDLIRQCPGITESLVHQMLDRTREFRTMEMYDARLLALGKLASGLAHELNNPASGASSSARSLAIMMGEAENASRALAAARLSNEQLAAVDVVRAECRRERPEWSALETADREDDFTDWLERHGAEPAAAVALAASDVSLAALDALAEALPPEVLGTVIRWVAACASARDVVHQIQTATGRIHDLVGSVKGFTFMDREAMPEDVDVAQGIADTLTMLESKASAKSIHMQVETASDMPRVYGYGSEINQVWEALIDNAIDAVGREGTVTVTATERGGSITVRVADDGPGIPEEDRPHVFEPFFTTKPVGGGTGLGLYQARRIVHLHNGDIDMTSRPGRTIFRVRLPVTGVAPGRHEGPPLPGQPAGENRESDPAEPAS